MLGTLRKRLNQSGTPIYLILVFSAFILSCKEKDKSNTLQNSQTESKTKPSDTILQVKQVPNDIFAPLYYDGQLSHWVRNIYQNKKGNLWFGTNHYGVMRYDGEMLEYFSEEQGVGNDRISGIAEDKEGNVWIATAGGLTKYDGTSFINFSENNNQINDEIWDIEIDDDGLIWLGTTSGVSQFDGKNFTSFPLPEIKVKDTTSIISYKRVSSILQDKKGALWFGTDGFGICKYDGRTFTHFTEENGLSNNNVADLLEDKDGNIWIGTMYGGISRYNGKTFTNFTKNGDVNGNEAYALYEDNIGNIWFAVENFGVYRYDGKSFTNYYTNEGLDTNGIQSIFEDREGRFWFGGWKGLFRYDGESFYTVTKEGPWD